MTSTTISAQQKAKAVGVEIRDLLARAAVAAPPAVVAAPCPYPARRKLSELVRDAGGHGWLWDGYVARGRVTLFASDPKCGKTTFLSHMYRQMAAGGEFCGRPLLPGKVLIVTEETDDDWIDRRDFLHIGDHVETLPVPFFGKPTHDEWAGFLAHIGTTFDADPVDVLVFDTLANMWPVKDENSAAEVGQALMPAKRLAAGRAVILVHHCRKSGGDDGAAIRGSSAFGGAVDQIVTFTRQSKAVDPHGRRREIHANGRMRGTPAEWVVELSADEQTMVKAAGGPGGDATGGRTDALRDAILAVLPSDGDGWTRDEIWDALPDAVRKNQVRFKSVLEAEVERLWEKNGDGTKKAAYRYRLAAPPGE